MKPGDRIFVAGHRGLVGSALVRRLQREGLGPALVRTRDELDLRDGEAVRRFLGAERPTHVFVAAARVGGILANSRYPVEFLRDNLAIELALIVGAHEAGVENLLFLASSCAYPREAPQPMKEEYLLSGSLEPTNQPYAIAKIAGIELCDAYRRQYGRRYVSVMPTNLYGPGDNFDPHNSHVVPAVIRRFHDAKKSGAERVTLWGTGRPRREFLHVDDLADACVFLMRTHRTGELVNIGVGADVRILELAEMVRRIVGWTGRIEWDTSRPDGAPRKLLDVSRASTLGWRAQIPLQAGIAMTYEWYERTASQGGGIRLEVPVAAR